MFNWIAQGKTTTIDIDDILRGSEYSLNKFTGNSSDANRFVNFSTTHNLNNTSQSFPFAGSSFPGGYVFYNFPSNDTYPNSVNETANYFTINAIDLYYYVSESSTSTDVATVEFLFPPIKYHKYASSSHSVTAVSPSTCYLYSIELNTHPYNWYYFDYPSSNYSTSTDTHTWHDKFGDTGSESTTATAPKIILTLKKDNLTYLNRNSVKAIPSGYVGGPAYDGWVELIMDCCVKGTVTNGSGSSSKTGAYKTRIKIKLIKLKAISEGDGGENKFFLGNKCPTEIYITNSSGGLVAVKEVYLGSVKVWPFTASDPETDIKDIFFRLRLRLNKFNFYFMGNESECVGSINDGSVFVSIDFTITNPAELDNSNKPIVFNSYASYNVRFADEYVIQPSPNSNYQISGVPGDFFTDNAIWCHKVLTGYYTSPLIDKIYSNSGNSLGYTVNTPEDVNYNILLEKNPASTVKTIDIKYYSSSATTDVFEHATCGTQGNNPPRDPRYDVINVSNKTCTKYLHEVSPFCMITLKFNFCLPHPRVDASSSYHYDDDTETYQNLKQLIEGSEDTDSTLQRRIKLNYQGQQHIFKLSDIYGLASQRLMNTNSKEHGVVKVLDIWNINQSGNRVPSLQSYDDDNINNYYGYLNSYEYPPIALGNDPGTAGLSFSFDVNIILRQNIEPDPDPSYPDEIPNQVYNPPIYKNVTWDKSIDTYNSTYMTISPTYSNGTQVYNILMNDAVEYDAGIQTNYTYDPPTSLHFSIEGADIILWVHRQNNSNVGSNRFEDLYLYIKKNCTSSVVTKKEGYNDWNGDPLSGANIITYAAGAPTGYSTPNTSTGLEPEYNDGEIIYKFHGWSLTSGRYCNIPKNPQRSSSLINCTGGNLHGIAHLDIKYSMIELTYMIGGGTGMYQGTGVMWYTVTYTYKTTDYVSFKVVQDPITKISGGGIYFSGGTIVSGVVSSTGGTSYGGLDPSTGH